MSGNGDIPGESLINHHADRELLSGKRLTASPRTSNWCRIADCVLRSCRNAGLSRSPLNATANRAALSMSNNVASSRGIERLCSFENGLTANPVTAAFNRSPTDEIYLPAEQSG